MNCWTSSINKRFSQTLCYLGTLLISSMLAAADFGVADWGMSVDEVKQLETRSNLTPFGESNYLIYAVSLGGIENTRIVYQFQNGRLTEGRFLFYPSNPMDATQAVRHYQSIKTMISGQYGPPNGDHVIPYMNDGSMMIAPESYANELASDRLILKSSWRSQTAQMNHQLAWNGNKPHHQLHYVPTTPMTNTPSTDAF